MKPRAVLTFALLAGVGTLQMVADVAQWPRVKALAAATQISPAMKVFTAQQGYETHAARFHLSWQTAAGDAQTLALDPRSYARVVGPYNRRNVYGAALAYGPVLRAEPRLRAMQASVMRYAFCQPGSMRQELGIPSDAVGLTVHVTPLRPTVRTDLELSWEVRCDD